jgi:hypothetical protein
MGAFMQVIARGRQQGKTEELIRLCAENKGILVCRDYNQINLVNERVEKMGLEKINCITHYDFTNKRLQGTFGTGIGGIYIDDVEYLLQNISPRHTVEAITLNTKV